MDSARHTVGISDDGNGVIELGGVYSCAQTSTSNFRCCISLWLVSTRDRQPTAVALPFPAGRRFRYRTNDNGSIQDSDLSYRVPPPEVELTLHSHAPQGAMARPVTIQGDEDSVQF